VSSVQDERSTPGQVRFNQESTERQYNLADKAKSMGLESGSAAMLVIEPIFEATFHQTVRRAKPRLSHRDLRRRSRDLMSEGQSRTFGRMHSARTGKAYLGYRPSKKSIKRMVENVHALTTRSWTWQETSEHAHLSVDQIGGEPRQAIRIVIRPANIDLQVLAFDIAHIPAAALPSEPCDELPPPHP
jgi:hypothetical protein